MTLSASTVFQIQSTATAANVNGCGFNPANANFPTDGVIASGTGNSPTLSSATYSFVAGDVGAWVYLPAQTSITLSGFFQIASVTGGVATLSAAVGQGVLVTPVSLYFAQIVAGVASTGSLSSVKFGVDYSQQDSAQYTATDLTGTTTTCTSVTNPFTPQMVGNLINLNSGTGVTAGRYEIVSISGSTATLDRSAGTTYSAVTYHTGGAASLGSTSDSALFSSGAASGVAGIIFWVKGGGASYTIGAASTLVTGNVAWHSSLRGYNATRGDAPVDNNRPLLNSGTIFTLGGSCDIMNMRIMSTVGTQSLALGVNSICYQVKITNNVGGVAIYDAVQANTKIIASEAISVQGTAIQKNVGGVVSNCYIHDSATGIILVAPAFAPVTNNIFSNCSTTAINLFSGGSAINSYICNNTLYGAENKIGVGLTLSAATTGNVFSNNIIYGFVTGVSVTGTTPTNYDDFNCYNNNTTDLSATGGWQKGPNDITTAPAFNDVTQITGSTATLNALVLTDTGANFSNVVDGVSYVRITGGTGATVGNYLITAHTTTTLTLDRTAGTNATANKTWQITLGYDWRPTATLSGAVFPGAPVGHVQIGALPMPPSTGGGGGSFTFS